MPGSKTEPLSSSICHSGPVYDPKHFIGAEELHESNDFSSIQNETASGTFIREKDPVLLS
jgi:hypothetical protein